jgi:signal transduction histidine kinase
LAALGAGASFLAHDIRNLLASLQLNAEQLQELPGEKEQRIGKRLATAIEQSLSLVEWAALYTSDKRDHLDVQRQKLRPIIADALNFVRLHDPRRRVQLVNDCLGNIDVVAERTLMFRILYNLALNAVQAMKGQDSLQQIRIRASSTDEACIIRVSDSGPGLPNENRGTLLMPHMSGARKPDSTGLGLKIVTDLVSWHGGRLDILHSDGHGTQFQITLPHEAPGAPVHEAQE